MRIGFRRLLAGGVILMMLMAAGCGRNITPSGTASDDSGEISSALSSGAESSGTGSPSDAESLPASSETAGSTSSSSAPPSSSASSEPIQEHSQLWLDNYAKYILPILTNQESFIASGFDYFITRQGNKLYDGTREFRFVSFNAANLLYNCDDTAIIVSTENRRRSSPFEITDTIKTIAQTGGQAVRCQAFAIRQPASGRAIIKHFYAPGEYDELLFRDLDRIFAECNRYQVRLILPIINPWPFYGSGADFDLLCGGPGTLASFYRREETIQEYKDFLKYLINRTNYYTGVKYKDEKALLCWELGNEITASSLPEENRATSAWMNDIAAYIKSLDPNHLVMDGGVTDPKQEIIDSPSIDILTTHYSPALSFPNKPTIHGEFDPTNGLNQAFIDYYMAKCVGMMAWNLDPHNKNGGFLYRQQDWKTPPLRWPGFLSGMPNEATQMALLRKNAFLAQGESVPAITVPDAPTLLPIGVPQEIRWRGSTGADTYIIQRSDSPEGPFVTIASNVEDSQVPRFTPYSDKTAKDDKVYYYRIIAKNRGGSSAPSNVVPCMPEILFADMEEETYGNQIVDEMNSLSKPLSHTGEIVVDIGKFGDPSALTFQSDSEIVYKAPAALKDYFLYIQWKNDAYMNIEISLSADGKSYTRSDPVLVNYGKSDFYFGRLERFPIGGSYRYIKIKVKYTAGIENTLYLGRFELDYK